MEPESVQVPVATGFTLQTAPNSSHTALFFKTKVEPGHVAVTMPNASLSRLVSLLLNRAQEVAGTVTPKDPGETLTSTPILASHMGVSKGRHETEALLAFRIGNLDLAFAVDAATLHKTCSNFLSLTKVVEPQKKQ